MVELSASSAATRNAFSTPMRCLLTVAREGVETCVVLATLVLASRLHDDL